MALLCFFLFIPGTAKAQSKFIPGRILVKTRPGVSDADLDSRLTAHKAVRHKKLKRANVHIVEVPEPLAESLLLMLRREATIEFAERDAVARAAFIPNDPLLVSGSEWHIQKINAADAWDLAIGNSNTIVAVLDSGVNSAHPELRGRILTGYNFVSGTNDTTDDFGHGTAVTGTIVAQGNNGIGVAGVAFGCSVLPVKVVDSSGFAAYSTVAEGIRYAVDHGARVINLSIAGSSASSTLQAAIDYAWSNNVVVVAAAGNNASNVPQYPAACNHVLGISATEPDDTLASFSTYGTNVTLGAPGDNIWTLSRDLSNPYAAWRGTSFSSPIVAGAAALVAAVNPTLSNDEIATLLEQTADDVGPTGFDIWFGYGRVNVGAAVTAAAALPGAQIQTNMPPVIDSQPPSETGPRPVLTNAVISIQINGLGRVTPNLNGKSLPIGNLVTLHALPGPGQVFAGWSGISSATELPVLTVVLQTNLSLTANFVASPFTALNGAYAGLLANTNAISPADSGAFKVNVNSSGTFSGRVTVGGRRHGIHGQLNLFGDAVISVSRNQLPPLTLTLHLDPAANDCLISGQITDGAWTSELLGERNVFNSKFNPAQQAGVRSFLLEQTGNQMAAAGTASSHIAKSGSAHVFGKLSNLRSFSTATILGKTGDYPFYLSFNHGLDVVIGWLNFPANQQATSTGSVFWVSSGTNAFTKSLQVNSL